MKRIILAAGMMAAALAPVWAQADYSIKEMTPKVKAALEARKDRFGQLKALKEQGFVGENNRGYVESLQDVTAVKDMVTAENRDRKVIYQAIVEQNQLGSGALATVEGVFAGVQREKAERGEKIQTEDGEWVRK